MNRALILKCIMVLITLTVFAVACSSDDDASPALSVTSFSPTSGPVGTTVVITGISFSSELTDNTVKFNGVTATVSDASSTELTVTVPASATSGVISVTVDGSTAETDDHFTVTTTTASTPTITSFTPTSGAIGTTVVITGTNFSTTMANNTVKFNGTSATVSAATATQLTVTVPTGATTGKIAVTVGSETGASSSDFTVSTTTSDCASASTQIENLVCLANAFMNTLSTSQKSSVVVTYNLTNAKRWSNLPCGLTCRNGLLFSSLSTDQQTAALALIAAASGTATNEGYEEWQAIRAADDYLGTLQGGYSAGSYVIAFLGTPSTTGKWMLQFGGHHYAQNITYDNGVVTSITPLHEAVEPNGSFTVNGTTYTSPLSSELAAVRAMLASFTTSELASAKISSTFSDCLMVPGSTTNTFPSTKQGIKVSTLSSTAQTNVIAAIAAWVNDVDPTTAATYLTTYTNEIADTYVTYSSNTSGVSGNASSFFTANTDYVRIDGPSVWIEFVCQSGVVVSGQIHYHTVMRDQSRDYIGL